MGGEDGKRTCREGDGLRKIKKRKGGGAARYAFTPPPSIHLPPPNLGNNSLSKSVMFPAESDHKLQISFKHHIHTRQGQGKGGKLEMRGEGIKNEA